jgi:formylglycine-generating enzyme required for sulfatase activity
MRQNGCMTSTKHCPRRVAPIRRARGSGEFHVIRGASWRHGSVTELRLAFRDYGKEARADLGFRLARYAE